MRITACNTTCTSRFKIYLKFGFGMSQKLYVKEFCQNGVLGCFRVYFSLRCAETPVDTTSSFKMDLKFGFSMSQNLYSIYRNLARKRRFRVVFVIFSLRMRRNTHNTTSGFKMDLGFRTGMLQNLCIQEFCPKTANFLGWVFVIFFTAHAQKHP